MLPLPPPRRCLSLKIVVLELRGTNSLLITTVRTDFLDIWAEPWKIYGISRNRMQNRFQVQGTVGEKGTVGPVTGQPDTQSYHTAKHSKYVVLHSELYLKVCFCFLLGIFVGALQVIYSLRDNFMQVVVYFQKHFPPFLHGCLFCGFLCLTLKLNCFFGPLFWKGLIHHNCSFTYNVSVINVLLFSM